MFLNCPYHCSIPVFPLIIQFQYLCISGDKIYYVFVVVQVVYMDEPSTGLDPASRYNLWNVVKQSKEGRAIILTTHSMEEAEALCDRLGIFVNGQLQCIGNAKELTARYGGLYVLTVTTPQSEEDEVVKLAQSLSSKAKKVYGLSGTQKFELPKDEVSIADVFIAVANAKNHLNIQAWGLADTTLEDVFVNIAKEAQGASLTLS
jgi:ABC-type multidrug transport system ATPase subunit